MGIECRDVLSDLLHGMARTGPVREYRPVYVDLLPPCNAGCGEPGGMMRYGIPSDRLPREAAQGSETYAASPVTISAADSPFRRSHV
jgi:hypothetical protein